LQSVGGLLLPHVGPLGVLARLGGDEFALLVPALGPGAVAEWLRRLVADVEDHNTRHDVFGVTFSIGIATRRAGEPLADTLRRADRRMYLMKGLRRAHRVRPPPWSPRKEDVPTWIVC
jgi:diguanylate cyclase (GGDEF)-like protein